MDYFLKANALIILFWLFYYAFLRNETFFKSIRVYFLLGLIVVISIPLIEIPIYVEQAVSNFNFYGIEGASSTNVVIEPTFDWSLLFMTIYFIGVVFFSFKFIFQLLSLRKLLIQHKAIRKDKYKLIETDKNSSPFSFFYYIIYNKNQFTEVELNQIIAHEKTHAQQWHSIDTLLTYILNIVFWFNPFARLYKKAVQQNLEFLADVTANKQRIRNNINLHY
ncbi:M56 family metallopeptidase [Aureibaculum sp. 2210JD6-5]|uniref:M56 family metallopeptidase n=1 Tax=Aureibaculum sp. 2210JD6-5 TaxID=3103957 RepID=UPI002AAC6526|nr:M56 family metallopeptidase [Aureibaculum sp. 2210JD6-5]MDY7394904.1 M56 family metallopeptidase [Aureibaculum sp. 2210JD6-5]